MKKLLMLVAVSALAMGVCSLAATAQAQNAAGEAPKAAPAEAPKAEPAPAAPAEAPKTEAPKADAPKTEPAAPAEAPKVEAPKVEAPKIDPAFEADIRKLLSLLKLEQSVRETMTASIDQIKPRYPQVPADRWTAALSKVTWSQVVDLQVPVYAKYMTPEDVKAAITFYESPSGARILAAQGPISRESITITRAWFLSAGQEILKEVGAQTAASPTPLR